MPTTMSRRAKRIIIPLVVGLVVLGILVVVFKGGPSKRGAQPAGSATNNQPLATQPATTPNPTGVASTSPDQAEASAQTKPAQPLGVLNAVAPPNDLGPRDQAPQALGSLDPRQDI